MTTDTGASSIQEEIKKITQAKPTGAEPFVHVIKNMYAVPTPGDPSKIEDFFDVTIKATRVNGKTFNDGERSLPGQALRQEDFCAQGRSSKGRKGRLHGLPPAPGQPCRGH